MFVTFTTNLLHVITAKGKPPTTEHTTKFNVAVDIRQDLKS